MTSHDNRSHQVWRRTLVLAVIVLGSLSSSTLLGQTVNGRLDRIGPFQTLHVWGTPHEMGYAHGYLLGKKILRAKQDSSALLPAEQRKQLDQAVKPLLGSIAYSERMMEELKGMLQGIEAAHGGPAQIDALGRPFGLDDLLFDNAGDTVRAFKCSGFTVWGENAGEHGLITTRNFDFALMFPTALEDQLILVRQPKGRHQVATITWPGYIGAFTGFNDQGVCTFMHDGTGPMSKQPTRKYTPVATVFTEILESSSSRQAHENAQRLLAKAAPYPFSYMLRVIAPRNNGANEKPSRIFRIDAGGLSENPVGNGSCITTNHYLMPSLDAPDNTNGWSLERYRRLTDRVASTVTPESAWAAQDAVSWVNGNNGTLHTLLVYPEKRMIDLGFASSNGKGLVSATKSKPTRISFEQLFRKIEP